MWGRISPVMFWKKKGIYLKDRNQRKSKRHITKSLPTKKFMFFLDFKMFVGVKSLQRKLVRGIRKFFGSRA